MTLVVDSSFCPDTRAAGWGLWCKRDGWARRDCFAVRQVGQKRDEVAQDGLATCGRMMYIMPHANPC